LRFSPLLFVDFRFVRFVVRSLLFCLFVRFVVVHVRCLALFVVRFTSLFVRLYVVVVGRLFPCCVVFVVVVVLFVHYSLFTLLLLLLLRCCCWFIFRCCYLLLTLLFLLLFVHFVPLLGIVVDFLFV
jgi:hypothetical protein